MELVKLGARLQILKKYYTMYIQYWSFIYVIWIYKIVVAYIESSGEIIHIIMK